MKGDSRETKGKHSDFKASKLSHIFIRPHAFIFSLMSIVGKVKCIRIDIHIRPAEIRNTEPDDKPERCENLLSIEITNMLRDNKSKESFEISVAF